MLQEEVKRAFRVGANIGVDPVERFAHERALPPHIFQSVLEPASADGLGGDYAAKILLWQRERGDQRPEAVSEDENFRWVDEFVASQSGKFRDVALGFEVGCSLQIRACRTLAVALAGLFDAYGNKSFFREP